MPPVKSVTSRTSAVTFDINTNQKDVLDEGHNPLSRRRAPHHQHGGLSGGGIGLGFASSSSSANQGGNSDQFARASSSSVDRHSSPSSVGIFGRGTTPASIATPITSPTGAMDTSSFPVVAARQAAAAGGSTSGSSSFSSRDTKAFHDTSFSFSGSRHQQPNTGSLNTSITGGTNGSPFAPTNNLASLDSSLNVSTTSTSTTAPRSVMGRFSAATAYQSMNNFLGGLRAEENIKAQQHGTTTPRPTSTTTSDTTTSAKNNTNVVTSWNLSTRNVDLLRASEKSGHPHLFDGDGILVTGNEANAHVHTVGRPHLHVAGDEATFRSSGSQRHSMSQEWLRRTIHVSGATPGEHDEIVDTLRRICGPVAHHRTLRFRTIPSTSRGALPGSDEWESTNVDALLPFRATSDIPTPLRITFSASTSADKAVALDAAGASPVTTSNGRRIAIIAGGEVSTTIGASGNQHMFLQDEEDHFYGETSTSVGRGGSSLHGNNTRGDDHNTTSSSRMGGSSMHSLHTNFVPRGGRRIETSSGLGLSIASGPQHHQGGGNGDEGEGCDLNRIIKEERINAEARVRGGKSGRGSSSSLVPTGGPTLGVVGVRRVKYPSLMSLPFAEYWLLPWITE